VNLKKPLLLPLFFLFLSFLSCSDDDSAVKEDFKLGIRFAKWLGLQEEGVMVQYGPDKTNYYRMAKIYKI
jgi:hypothetical protein